LSAAAFAAATMLGTGVAWAAGVTLPFSGDRNTINGCYSSGGALKVLTPSSPTCPAGYIPIHWNQTGPQGPQGTPPARKGQQARRVRKATPVQQARRDRPVRRTGQPHLTAPHRTKREEQKR
jgi:hypothetical protein